MFEVYPEMSCGFLEVVYQECLAQESKRHGLSVYLGTYPKARMTRLAR